MPARLIVVAGPTASGKSALAAAVAAACGGTVINADSMQVYADLAILTARPGPALLARAPHLLYGFLDGDAVCSAPGWATLAAAEIAICVGERRVPVLCGGTGLYLQTLLRGIAAVPPIPAWVRAAARARHAEMGGARFRDALAALDPTSATELQPGDSQRLVRAYEVVLATGRPIDAWQRGEPVRFLPLDCEVDVTLVMPPRAALHAAIDARFAGMLEAGALDEVSRLLSRRLEPSRPVMKALGVAPLARHLRGACSLETAVLEAQAATRQYAKRQSTWFRHRLGASRVLTEQLSERNLPGICQKICRWP